MRCESSEGKAVLTSRLRSGWLVGALLLCCAPVRAQTVAVQAAAATQRPADFDHPPALAQPPHGDVERPLSVRERPHPVLPADAGPAFRVDRVVLDGVTVLPEAERVRLRSLVEGKSVRLRDLNVLTAAIEQAYRTRGYFLARAAVPPQEVTSGTVRIVVSEGHYGILSIEGNEHYSTNFIRRFFAPALEGGLVRERPLLAALVQLNQIPDLAAQSVLAPGKAKGTSDLTVRVKDEQPVHVSMDYNNLGSRLVGRNRVAITVNAGRAFVEGDDMALRVSDPFPGGSDPFYQANYSRPIGSAYDRIAFLYASAQTRVVGSGLDDLQIRGTADIAGLSWQHPIVSRPDEQSSFSAGFQGKNLRNFVLNDTPTTHDKVREATAGYTLSQRKGKRQLAVSAQLYQGLGTALGGSASDQPTPSRVGAGDAFTKLTLDASAVQQLGDHDYLVLRASAQGATRPLVVAEQFAIGGLDSVRGFNQSVELGDDGYSATLEARHDILRKGPDTIQGAAFVDHGEIHLHNPQAGEQASRGLTGWGVGLRAFLGTAATLRLDYGLPLSPNRDFDGEKGLLYAQAAYRY